MANPNLLKMNSTRSFCVVSSNAHWYLNIEGSFPLSTTYLTHSDIKRRLVSGIDNQTWLEMFMLLLSKQKALDFGAPVWAEGLLAAASRSRGHATDQHLNDDVSHCGCEDESEDVVIHVVSFQVSL